MKLKLNVFTKQLLLFLIQLLLSEATTRHGFRPFGLGFYAALVYGGENVVLASAFYMASEFLAEPTIKGLVYAASSVVVLTVCCLAHHFLKKHLTMRLVNVYAFIAQIPVIVLKALDGNFLFAFTSGIIAQIFCYAAVIIVYALLVRGLKCRLTVDELAAGGIMLVALSLAAENVSLFGVTLLGVIAPFAVLLVAYLFKEQSALIFVSLMGVGAAFSNGNVSYVGTYVMMAVCAALFIKLNAASAALATVVAEVVAAYYFDAYEGYTYVNLICTVVSAAAFLAIPKKSKMKMLSFTKTASDGVSGKKLVNKDRSDISKRLYAVAGIFEDMRDLVSEEVSEVPPLEESVKKISKDVALNFCAKCPEAEKCFSALNSDTSVVLEDLVSAVFQKGRCTIMDMPPFITSRCKQVNALVSVVNDKTVRFSQRAKLNAEMDNCRLMLAKQMGGTAEILENMATDIKKTISFDAGRETLIVDELAYHNIVCSEAMVYGEGSGMNVTLVVRPQDADKKILPKIVSKIIKYPLIVSGGTEIIGEKAGVNLVVKPRYNVVFGEAMRSASGENYSGDQRSVQRVGEDKVVFALCDGMGHGKHAMDTSSAAISLIENFYKAGFENGLVLELVNKLLSMKNEENFSTLDMCVLDLNTGGADIVKMGAADGFLKRKESVEVIESKVLPVGIVDEVKPVIERRIMFGGDMMVLVSDGVTDVLGSDGVRDLVARSDTANPQMLAESVIDAAAKAGATDDITAFCIRVYAK